MEQIASNQLYPNQSLEIIICLLTTHWNPDVCGVHDAQKICYTTFNPCCSSGPFCFSKRNTATKIFIYRRVTVKYKHSCRANKTMGYFAFCLLFTRIHISAFNQFTNAKRTPHQHINIYFVNTMVHIHLICTNV